MMEEEEDLEDCQEFDAHGSPLRLPLNERGDQTAGNDRFLIFVPGKETAFVPPTPEIQIPNYVVLLTFLFQIFAPAVITMSMIWSSMFFLMPAVFMFRVFDASVLFFLSHLNGLIVLYIGLAPGFMGTPDFYGGSWQ